MRYSLGAQANTVEPEKLGKANGAYRADVGGGSLVYMTFGEITLSNNELKK